MLTLFYSTIFLSSIAKLIYSLQIIQMIQPCSSKQEWYIFKYWWSCSQDTCSSNSSDLLLGDFTEKLGLDDNWLGGEEAFSENLEVSSLGDINDGNSILIGSMELSGLFSDEGPNLIDVNWGEMLSVSLEVEDPDTLLSEVAGMVAIHGGSIVLETTSVTSTSWVFSVSSDSAASAADWTSKLSNLSQPGCHDLW